ncbi:MAG: hypothetical protein ABF370_07675 [Verrucomicrobiales bacterium]|nr:hypothetical protein [Verrucomicrobiaceae bacterium]
MTHASPASLQALTTTTAQLRQQVRNLQTELASLKQVIANNTLEPQRVSGAVSPPFGRRVDHWTGGNKRDWGHEQAAGAPDTGRAGDVPSA